jgi:tryptophan synthase alpha chain
VLGITGTKSASEEAVRSHVGRIKRHTALPVAVGFGIKTPEQAAAVARHADAAVVGSAIVDQVKVAIDADGKPKADLVPGVLGFVKSLAEGVRSVKKA